MKKLTLTQKDRSKLQLVAAVVPKEWTVAERQVLDLSRRRALRIPAVYKAWGVAPIAHGNRGRVLRNAAASQLWAWTVSPARDRHAGLDHTHLNDLIKRATVTKS